MWRPLSSHAASCARRESWEGATILAHATTASGLQKRQGSSIHLEGCAKGGGAETSTADRTKGVASLFNI